MESVLNVQRKLVQDSPNDSELISEFFEAVSLGCVLIGNPNMRSDASMRDACYSSMLLLVNLVVASFCFIFFLFLLPACPYPCHSLYRSLVDS